MVGSDEGLEGSRVWMERMEEQEGVGQMRQFREHLDSVSGKNEYQSLSDANKSGMPTCSAQPLHSHSKPQTDNSGKSRSSPPLPHTKGTESHHSDHRSRGGRVGGDRRMTRGRMAGEGRLRGWGWMLRWRGRWLMRSVSSETWETILREF